jgi:hypothetical protein
MIDSDALAHKTQYKLSRLLHEGNDKMFSFGSEYVDERYFCSKSQNRLSCGGEAREIFLELSAAMLEMAQKHGKRHAHRLEEVDYPFWYSEQKFSWMLPVFFHKNGYLVWSEWAEDNTRMGDDRKKHRRIDFLFSRNNTDLFLELKYIFSNLRGSNLLRKDQKKKLVNHEKNGLLDQVYDMKRITGNYSDNKIICGLLIVRHNVPSSEYRQFSESFGRKSMQKKSRGLLDEIHELLDRRRNLHLIGRHAIVNWDEDDIEGMDRVPKMISIVGIFYDPQKF